MNKYVILLRGINVGGNNPLPMKELRECLMHNGFKSVQTYIQSGNIVLEYRSRPGERIAKLIEKEFGFGPGLVVLSKNDFTLAVENNPFPEAERKSTHFYFCSSKPKPDKSKLRDLRAKKERYEVSGKVFYLSAPDGIGRSKLAAGIESCLGVSATGRNLNTINKLGEMLENT